MRAILLTSRRKDLLQRGPPTWGWGPPSPLHFLRCCASERRSYFRPIFKSDGDRIRSTLTEAFGPAVTFAACRMLVSRVATTAAAWRVKWKWQRAPMPCGCLHGVRTVAHTNCAALSIWNNTRTRDNERQCKTYKPLAD